MACDDDIRSLCLKVLGYDMFLEKNILCFQNRRLLKLID